MAGEEKTALEIILELPSILKKMENKIDVLDTNLKILNSKLNKLKSSEQLPQHGKTADREQPQDESDDNANPEEKRLLPTATPGPIKSEDSTQIKAMVTEPKKLVLGSTKVFSNIKTASGKPVDGMTINIFDTTNELIRSLITTKEGYWECRLPHGKYSLEMIHPKLKTMNKSFEIQKDVKIFEVI
jgi:hypothetical protein